MKANTCKSRARLPGVNPEDMNPDIDLSILLRTTNPGSGEQSQAKPVIQRQANSYTLEEK
jgi:hypothetical protein